MADKLFGCPGCGADLEWKPGSGALNCPYCAHHMDDPAAAESFTIQEYRLDQAAELAPRGFGTELTEYDCGSCGAVSGIDPAQAFTQCPFCGSDMVTEQDHADVIRPESVLPFRIEKNDALRKFREWLGSLWFRPSSLQSSAQIQAIKGVYVPVWTFDTATDSFWRADAGHYFEEEEQYTTEEDGKQVTKTRRVRKTRWEPASGRLAVPYDDWLVQASGGLDQQALKGLEPFDTAQLVPFDTKYLAGFSAERYKIDLESAWQIAQNEIDADVHNRCRSEVPGDTQRGLVVSTNHTNVTFKHTMLPIYVAAYRYNNEVYRYLVNGYTGKTTGDAPISWPKVILAVVGVILLIGMCCGGLSLFSSLMTMIGGR